MKKRLSILIFAMSLVISLAGCGNSQYDNKSAFSEASTAAVEKASDEAKVESSEEALTQYSKQEAGEGKTNDTLTKGQGLVSSSVVSQKIIFSGQIIYETLEFEKTRTNLCDYIISVGGFIQNSNIQAAGINNEGLSSAEYVFRVPKARYNQAFIDLKKFGTVVSEQSTGEDVTEQYFDTEARLKSLKIRQERLESLLEKATKMDDILKIEKDLQTVLYEIENYTGTLKKWDSLVAYSTLMVNIREVEKIKPAEPKKKDGFLYRMAAGFERSVSGLWEFVQNLIIFIVAALPIALPLGAIAYIIYKIYIRRVARSGNKKVDSDSGSQDKIE